MNPIREVELLGLIAFVLFLLFLYRFLNKSKGFKHMRQDFKYREDEDDASEGAAPKEDNQTKPPVA